MRPEWDDIWMAMADTIARRSLCSRAQVGCVLVRADNFVAAATYNGPSPKFNHGGQTCEHWCDRVITGVNDPSYASCPSTHAEASALIRANASELHGSTMYVTSSMCINCAKLVGHSGVERVVHRVLPEHEYRNPAAVEAYLRIVGIESMRWLAT
jgi:dCMP deaminase